MLTPNEAYQYDPTFRRVVDLMCAYLSVYEITPSELRQAAILAYTMHESERIRPLLHTKPSMTSSPLATVDSTPRFYVPQPWGGMEVFIDEAKDIPPAMFGGLKTDDTATEAMRTATGSTFNITGCTSGRIQSAVPNFTEQDKQAGLEKDYNMMLKYNCICGYKGSNKDLHSHTCMDYNWSLTHTKAPEHCHMFGIVKHSGIFVCTSCGMSDVYFVWSSNRK